MKKSAYSLAILTLLVVFPSSIVQGQRRGTNRLQLVEPNVYAPGLYAERLKLRFSLINLPGAGQGGSRWDGVYKLYFIDEQTYQQTFDRLIRENSGGFDPEPSQFPNKILLAGGSFSSRRLKTLHTRTYLTVPISFKNKVPDRQRTKLGRLMTSYTVKIYDAQLKKTIYETNSWLTLPFDDDPARPEKAVPRTMLYANFFISPQAELFKSQWPRNDSDTNW